MPYQFKAYPNEAILLVSLHDPLDLESEIENIFNEISAKVDQMQHPAVIIHDFRDFTQTFSGLMMGLQAQTQTPNAPGTITDARTRTIIVGSNEIARMAAEAVRQEQYGGLDIPIYETVEEAETRARQMLQDA